MLFLEVWLHYLFHEARNNDKIASYFNQEPFEYS